MSESSLPTGWVITPIENCLLPYPNGKRIRQGWSPRCEKFPAMTENHWGVLKTSAIQDGNFVEEENKHLPSKLEPKSHLEVEPGDILITCAGPRSRCGVACLVRKTRPRLIISGKMYQLRADPSLIDRNMLELFLREPHTQRRIDELKTGISDSGLNLTHGRFATLEIPLPPLAEQKRIVEKIEELFSELDDGEASLRRARKQLGVYRQSLLKQAFEGKLTAQWRAQNPDLLESPDKLLQKIQDEREARYQQQLKKWKAAGSGRGKPKMPKNIERASPNSDKVVDVPPEWFLMAIEDLLTSKPTNGRSVRDRTGGFKVLRLTALKEGRIDLTAYKEGDWERSEAESFLVKKGQFLLSRGNGSIKLVGRGGVVPNDAEVAYPDTMIRLPLDLVALDADFFSLIWNSEQFRRQVEASARTTAGIYKINQALICGYIFPVCSLPEQREIVRLLDEQFEVIEQNEREIDAALKRSEALRQSILKKAFTGQLVPQNPEDEPAYTLLTRIQDEREKTAEFAWPKKKVAKKKTARKRPSRNK